MGCGQCKGRPSNISEPEDKHIVPKNSIFIKIDRSDSDGVFTSLNTKPTPKGIEGLVIGEDSAEFKNIPPDTIAEEMKSDPFIDKSKLNAYQAVVKSISNPIEFRQFESRHNLISSKTYQEITISEDFNPEYFHPQTTYNVIVWAQSKNSLHNIYEKPIVQKNMKIGTDKVKIRFNLIPIWADNFSNAQGKVIDSICYLMTSKADEEKILKINEVYNHVWSHFIIKKTYDDAETLGARIHAKVVGIIELVYEHIYLEDMKIHLLLKNVFDQIDKDKSGNVDLQELLEATHEIGSEVNAEDIQSAMKNIDENKDGKINFKEFIFWWKKGRQGGMCFTKLMNQWASEFTSKVVGSTKLIPRIHASRLGISRKTLLRTAEFCVGPDFNNPKISLNLNTGSGTYRERLLYDVSNSLDLHSKECWFSFALYNKPNKDLVKNLNYLQTVVETCITLLLDSAYDSALSDDSIGPAYGVHNGRVMFGMWFDINLPGLAELSDAISFLDGYINTPTDQTIEIKLSIQEGIMAAYNSTENNFLFPLLQKLKLFVATRYWANLQGTLMNLKNIFASNFYVSSFMSLFTGEKHSMKYQTIPEIPPELMAKIDEFGARNDQNALLKFLRNLINSHKENPIMKSILYHITENYLPKADIYLRHKNLGINLQFQIEDLFELFKYFIVIT
jgi:hypothetical protein